MLMRNVNMKSMIYDLAHKLLMVSFVRRVELQQKMDKLKVAKEERRKRKEAESLKDNA